MNGFKQTISLQDHLRKIGDGKVSDFELLAICNEGVSCAIMAQLRMTIIREVAALLNYMIGHEEKFKLDRQPCRNQHINRVHHCRDHTGEP